MLTLEYLKLAFENKEDISGKLKQCIIPTDVTSLDDLTVEEYLTVCLTAYFNSDKKLVNERGYFFKATNEHVVGVSFLNATDGFFITVLWGLDGDDEIHE